MITRAFLIFGLAGTPLLAAAQEKQPNIVVMLSDDMGWGQVGCQGGTVIPTPNIDSIASEGVSLTQFYVEPVCAPTRSAFLTGRYPSERVRKHASPGMTSRVCCWMNAPS